MAQASLVCGRSEICGSKGVYLGGGGGGGCYFLWGFSFNFFFLFFFFGGRGVDMFFPS